MKNGEHRVNTIPETPPRETYAKAVLQVFEAVLTLANLGDDFAEHTTVHASLTSHVHSEAEVDAAAAMLGTTAERCGPWGYRAVKCNGPVTVTVSFTSGPEAPADAATIDSICDWARRDLPRSAA